MNIGKSFDRDMNSADLLPSKFSAGQAQPLGHSV